MKGKIARPRPDTMEAQRTIYRDKLNGRQCEAVARQRCSNDFGFVLPAAPFLNSRYTAMREEGGRSKTTSFNPFDPGAPSRVYKRAFSPLLPHRNTLSTLGRFKFSLREERK